MNLYKQGLSYSTLNTARSALSTIVILPGGGKLGTNSLVTRFMKGVFEIRKPSPKYDKIWDVSLVLNYLSKLYPNDSLTLKELTLKTVMLILLVSCQRGQAVHFLDLKHMTVTVIPECPLPGLLSPSMILIQRCVLFLVLGHTSPGLKH